MIRKKPSGFKPSLESLEDRLCPSAYSIVDLPPPSGWWMSTANAVNEAGWVVGYGADEQSFASAVLWRLDAGGNVVTAPLPEIFSRASMAHDINSLRQVVGFSDTTLSGPDPQTTNIPHAVLWELDSAGVVTGLTDLGGLPNHPFTEAYAINNQSQVVGSAHSLSTSGFGSTVFLWDASNGMQDLNTMLPIGSGWELSSARDINDKGQIVGSGSHNGVNRGYRFDLASNTILDLGSLPGGAASGANAINSLGSVAGAAETGQINRYNRMNSDAVLYQNGALTDLGSLGDAGSTAFAVNDAGVVVGRYFNTNHDPFNNISEYDSRAFIWQNGVMTDLAKLLPKSAKWVLFGASDINATGSIVGSATVPFGSGSYQNHGYLMVPPSAPTATPGITVTPTSGLQTNESGGTASFTVVLNTMPTADVIIYITSLDSTEGTVSVSRLVFTPQNWNVPQTVTITGVDDTEKDGDQSYTIELTASSDDLDYGLLDPADVLVTNKDNEKGGRPK